jgi:hypothetical protein
MTTTMGTTTLPNSMMMAIMQVLVVKFMKKDLILAQ